MAVTNTNIFTVTRDDIIKAALRVIGVLAAGETPIQEDYTNCNQALNIMIKSWAKKGLPLWVTQEISLPMVPTFNTYPIGPLGGTLASAGITITSGGSGGTNGTYALGIVDSTGTGATGTFTVVANKVSSITITNAGSGYTAPTFTYSTSGITGAVISCVPVGLATSRPLRIISAYRRDNQNTDTPLTMLSREEYQILGFKQTPAKVNLFYYDQLIETSQLYVYNQPDVLGDVLKLQTQRQFFDMTNGTDNFDFPQSWFQALKWGLAAELCVEYSVNVDLIPYYEQKALAFGQEAFDESVEEAPIYFTVSRY